MKEEILSFWRKQRIWCDTQNKWFLAMLPHSKSMAMDADYACNAAVWIQHNPKPTWSLHSVGLKSSLSLRLAYQLWVLTASVTNSLCHKGLYSRPPWFILLKRLTQDHTSGITIIYMSKLLWGTDYSNFLNWLNLKFPFEIYWCLNLYISAETYILRASNFIIIYINLLYLFISPSSVFLVHACLSVFHFIINLSSLWIITFNCAINGYFMLLIKHTSVGFSRMVRSLQQKV